LLTNTAFIVFDNREQSVPAAWNLPRLPGFGFLYPSVFISFLWPVPFLRPVLGLLVGFRAILHGVFNGRIYQRPDTTDRLA